MPDEPSPDSEIPLREPDAPRPVRPKPRPPEPRVVDEYAIAGDEPEPTAYTPPPIDPPRARSKPSAERSPTRERGEGRARPARPDDDEPAVEEVWTRMGEWGPTLARLAIAGAAALPLLWFTFSFDYFLPSMLLVAACGAGMVALAYPIAITMERPVRVTPQQAVEDYYQALSHHFPHYRRMWLLLARAGKTSGVYGSPEGFRSYWKGRIARLKAAGKASGSTPLLFEVAEFESDKGAGATRVDAGYDVRVYVRGRKSEGPIEVARVRTELVRGPDRMWYLTDGTLDGGRL